MFVKISMKNMKFHSKNRIWKCHLPKSCLNFNMFMLEVAKASNLSNFFLVLGDKVRGIPAGSLLLNKVSPSWNNDPRNTQRLFVSNFNPGVNEVRKTWHSRGLGKWVGLWDFLWWVPSAKRKDHQGVSSGWSTIWICSNTVLSIVPSMSRSQ